MGTNYYLYQKPVRMLWAVITEPLHIGKSSGGWCFSLHVIPEDNINDLDDWRVLWNEPGSFIKNEYGEKVSVANMEDIITNRSWAKIPSDGAVHAEPGPNNLARAIVDGRHCIKHGAGTWDCITGEFS